MNCEPVITGQILIAAYQKLRAPRDGCLNHRVILGISTQGQSLSDSHYSTPACDVLEILPDVLIRVSVLQRQPARRECTSQLFHQGDRNDDLECTASPGFNELCRKSVGVQERRDPDVRVQHYGGGHSSALWDSRLAAVISASISSLEKRRVFVCIPARNSLNSFAKWSGASMASSTSLRSGRSRGSSGRKTPLSKMALITRCIAIPPRLSYGAADLASRLPRPPSSPDVQRELLEDGDFRGRVTADPAPEQEHRENFGIIVNRVIPQGRAMG